MLSTKEGSNNRDQLGGSWYEVPCWWENNVLQYYPVPPFLCRLVDGFVFSKKRNSYQLSTCPLRPKYSTLVLEVFVTWGRILLSKKKHGHWRHWWFRWKISPVATICKDFFMNIDLSTYQLPDFCWWNQQASTQNLTFLPGPTFFFK